MRYVLLLLFTGQLLFFGCSDDSDSSSNNPFAPNNSSVQVTIGLRQSPNNAQKVQFTLKSNVDIYVTKITAAVASANYTDTWNTNNTDVWKANTDIAFAEYNANEVPAGEKWDFTFEGTVVSGGASYTVSASYTVGGGGGGGSVTVQVNGQTLQDGSFQFYVNPSVNITIASVTASVASANYSETFQGNNTDIFQAGQWSGFIYYNQGSVLSGEIWKFDFSGTIQSSGQQYTASATFTVP